MVEDSSNAMDIAVSTVPMYRLDIKGTKIELTLDEAQTLFDLLQEQLKNQIHQPTSPGLKLYDMWKLSPPPSTTPQRPFEAIWQVFPQDLPQYQQQPSPFSTYRTTGVESTPQTTGINVGLIVTSSNQ